MILTLKYHWYLFSYTVEQYLKLKWNIPDRAVNCTKICLSCSKNRDFIPNISLNIFDASDLPTNRSYLPISWRGSIFGKVVPVISYKVPNIGGSSLSSFVSTSILKLSFIFQKLEPDYQQTYGNEHVPSNLLKSGIIFVTVLNTKMRPSLTLYTYGYKMCPSQQDDLNKSIKLL